MITQNKLKSILKYIPETGEFIWKKTRRKDLIGGTAGSLDINGYIIIKIGNRQYKAHRLAFLYMNGALPFNEVDHINSIKDDNKWENLRESTRTQNNYNRKVQSNNLTRYKGVTRQQNGKYIARTKANRKSIYLGQFLTALEASQAYKEFSKKLHGEFYHD